MALFENAQWAVRDWGMQSVRPGAPFKYNITASRLLETQDAGGGEFYDWPVHLAEKTWVNIDTFLEAYENALAHHKGAYAGEVDAALLKKSAEEARKRAKLR